MKFLTPKTSKRHAPPMNESHQDQWEPKPEYDTVTILFYRFRETPFAFTGPTKGIPRRKKEF
jgi:hypothetical protein